MEDIVPVWPGTGDEATGIFFTNHDVEMDPAGIEHLSPWISHTIEKEGFELTRLDFIFCSDEFLLEINRSHLGHDYYTDILTFPLNRDPILAEIYISLDRVKENASALHIPFEEELHRVMIHGVLHLCGYDDHTEEDIRIIRGKEEECLKYLSESAK